MPADRVRKRSRELPVGIRVLTSSPPLARLVPSRSRQLTYTAMICCTCQSSYSLDALLFCIQVPTSTVPLCRGNKKRRKCLSSGDLAIVAMYGCTVSA
ncbi:hypothetical protein RB195_022420 [Necator americanus]|uniref:Uncharacterized protein n=1 Tax=Necator americanus TaxID=51031 RepID=A0ABR1EFJ1_NECAM